MINRALPMKKYRNPLRSLGPHTEQRSMLLTIWGTF